MWKKQNTVLFRWVVVGIGMLCSLLVAGCGNHCCSEDSFYEVERRHELERQKRVDPFDPERGEISLPTQFR